MVAKLDKNIKSVVVSELGLKIEINPYHLLSAFMDLDGKAMLKDMIYDKLIDLVEELRKDYINYKHNATQAEKDKIDNKEVIVASVKDYATFIRQIAILSLEVDIDTYFEGAVVSQPAMDWAYNLLKYCDKYGYQV